jgi:serine protease DegS
MNLLKLRHGATFLAGAITGGLALAFIAVLLHPELLVRPPAATAPAAPVTAASPSALAPAPATLPAESAPAGSSHTFAPAVRRAAPAVVNINTRALVTEQVQPSIMDQMFGDSRPRYHQSVQRGLGSGVIVDAAGHLVTNNHVIANADEIRVKLADGRETQATVVGRDPDTDLAVLAIKLPNLPVMTLGHSDRLQVGDEVLAIGEPLGLSQTVTHGIVSALGREVPDVAALGNFIQTDAAINEGNSGGALINADGELVGINTAVIAKNTSPAGVEGIGFAIPVNLVRGVMQQILAQGRVIRGWLGVSPADVSDEQARQLGLAQGGVVVVKTDNPSPAQSAGLLRGDIVVAINGRKVRNSEDALVQIAALQPGSSVTLQVLRGTHSLTLRALVSERRFSNA